ncbi:hypothetical protein D3C80_1524580 [compost metagenome]
MRKLRALHGAIIALRNRRRCRFCCCRRCIGRLIRSALYRRFGRRCCFRLGRLRQATDHVIHGVAVEPKRVSTTRKQQDTQKGEHITGIVTARLFLDHVGCRWNTVSSNAGCTGLIRAHFTGNLGICANAVITNQLFQIVPRGTFLVGCFFRRIRMRWLKIKRHFLDRRSARLICY